MTPFGSVLRQILAMLAVVQACTSGARAEDAIEVGALRVSALFAKDAGRHLVHAGTQADHFHVILENVSAKPLKLWRGRAYLGYASLSFRLTDRTGAVVIVKRTPLPAGSEPDMSLILEPGERLVIDIYPRSSEWSGFPIPSDGNEKVSLQAIYTSEIPKADVMGWTGQAVSPIYDIEWSQ